MNRGHDRERGRDRGQHATPIHRSGDDHRKRGQAEQLSPNQHLAAVDGDRSDEHRRDQQHEREPQFLRKRSPKWDRSRQAAVRLPLREHSYKTEREHDRGHPHTQTAHGQVRATPADAPGDVRLGNKSPARKYRLQQAVAVEFVEWSRGVRPPRDEHKQAYKKQERGRRSCRVSVNPAMTNNATSAVRTCVATISANKTTVVAPLAPLKPPCRRRGSVVPAPPTSQGRTRMRAPGG